MPTSISKKTGDNKANSMAEVPQSLRKYLGQRGVIAGPCFLSICRSCNRCRKRLAARCLTAFKLNRAIVKVDGQAA